MQRRARRIRTALAVAAATGLITTTAADAATPPQSVTATDVTSGPFHFSVHATRPAGQPETAATGTFDAFTKVGSFNLMDIHGPVTCLNVRGNRVGLFYPIQTANPALLAKIGSGIMIYMTVDGKGHATAVQFLPLPFRKVSSCAPTVPSLLPATGSATLTS